MEIDVSRRSSPKDFRPTAASLVFISIFLAMDALIFLKNVEEYSWFLEISRSSLVKVGFQGMEIALSYLLLVSAISCLLSFVQRALCKQRSQVVKFYFLIFLTSISYLFLKSPQIFYSLFRLDRVYQYFPLPWGVWFFWCALFSLGSYAVFRLIKSSKPRLGAALAIVFVAFWSLDKCHSIYHFNYFPKISGDPFSGDRQVVLVISLDSVNASDLPFIEAKANSALRGYLKRAKIDTNVISDITQTHGSLFSVFSGQQAFEQRKRYPFADTFLRDGQNDLFTLAELKKSNFKNVFYRDETVTTVFQQGPLIDRFVTSYTKGTTSQYFNPLFESPLVFGLSPDFLSRAVFPYVFNSSRQAFGYDPGRIAQQMSSLIDEEITDGFDKRNRFIFFHTCLLHFPRSLPYPYYPQRAAPPDGGEALSSIDLRNVSASGFDFSLQEERSEFEASNFKLGLAYLTEDLLNPLFADLEKKGLLDKAKIILMSDHGEADWTHRQFLPQRPLIPYHGDTDLYGSNAERPLFMVSSPKPEVVAPHVGEPINLSQIFRQTLGLTYKKDVYSENAYNPIPNPADLSFFIPPEEITNWMHVEGDAVSLGDDFEAPSFLDKERTVFKGDFKLTLIRTTYGRRLILCNYKLDKECSKNLWNDRGSRSVELVSALNEKLKPDESRGLDLTFKLTADGELDQLSDVEKHLRSDNKWLRLYGAVVAYGKFFNAGPILQVEKELSNTKRDLFTRYFYALLFRRCREFGDIVPSFIEGMNTYFSRFPSRYLALAKMNRCFEWAHETAAAADFRRYVGSVNELGTLSRTLSSYALTRLLVEQPGVARSGDGGGLERALLHFPLKERERLSKQILENAESIFHYAREYHFPTDEANYWYLRYLVQNSLGKRKEFFDSVIERVSEESQSKGLELALVEGLRRGEISSSIAMCRSMRRIIGDSVIAPLDQRRLRWKKVYKQVCDSRKLRR